MPEAGADQRRDVRGWIEEASGRALPVNDPLPDELIAEAEALGLSPLELRARIEEQIQAAREALP